MSPEGTTNAGGGEGGRERPYFEILHRRAYTPVCVPVCSLSLSLSLSLSAREQNLDERGARKYAVVRVFRELPLYRPPSGATDIFPDSNCLEFKTSSHVGSAKSRQADTCLAKQNDDDQVHASCVCFVWIYLARKWFLLEPPCIRRRWTLNRSCTTFLNLQKDGRCSTIVSCEEELNNEMRDVLNKGVLNRTFKVLR